MAQNVAAQAYASRFQPYSCGTQCKRASPRYYRCACCGKGVAAHEDVLILVATPPGVELPVARFMLVVQGRYARLYLFVLILSVRAGVEAIGAKAAVRIAR